MENNLSKKIPMIPFQKTKRLDTIKKKARELSILCNIDVCLVGSHHSQPDMWRTWPENQNELDRVVKKYKKKVEEKKSKKDLGKRAILEFDVDKALEGMSDEQLRLVLDRTDEISGDVDQKLDALLSKQNSCKKNISPSAPFLVSTKLEFLSTRKTPMILDLPSKQTMDEANSDKFDSEGTHTTQTINDSSLNQTKEEAQGEEFHFGVARKGPKIFGVFLTPAMET